MNTDGTAGAASIFITGINAPDGIAIDRKDNLWVCANQEDDIIVLDKTGKVIAKLGDFNGINDDGIVTRSAFPGEPRLQQGRQDTLRIEPEFVPALCRRPGSCGFGVDAQGQALHGFQDAGVIPPLGHENDQRADQQ